MYPRALDFHRNHLTRAKARAVNLSEAGRGDWLVFEALEYVFNLRVKLVLDYCSCPAGVEGRHLILQPGQLPDVFDREQIGAGRKRLTCFDEGGSELNQLAAQQLSFLPSQLGIRKLSYAPASGIQKDPKHEKEECDHHPRHPRIS